VIQKGKPPLNKNDRVCNSLTFRAFRGDYLRRGEQRFEDLVGWDFEGEG
jgi:hypothetical protein